MTGPSVSVRDLAFVRDVLIPRVAYLSGPEIEALLELKARIETVFAALRTAPPRKSEPEAPSC